MKNYIKPALLVITGALLAVIFSKCKKVDYGTQSSLTADTTLKLKDAVSFYIGAGVSEDSFLNDGMYAYIVKTQFNNVTPGNSMKHASLLSSTGVFNFTTADAFVNAAINAGLSIFGHTLVWHSQQETAYLVDSLITKPQSYDTSVVSATTITVPNNDFETAGSGTAPFANWSVYNTQNATISMGSAAESYHGSGCLKVVNTVSNGINNSWKVQLAGTALTLTSGVNYTIKAWAKADAVGSNGFRFEVAGGTGTQYLSHQVIGTSYQQYSWSFTATGSSHTLVFDLGADANTYYIDSLRLEQTGSGSTVITEIAPTDEEIKYRVDTNMVNYIKTVVGRYKSSVNAWDVVNEPINEDGSARTNDYDVSGGKFYRAKYLGLDSMCYKAFVAAHEANPDAKLFLNEYNLESNAIKLDSFIALVSRLKDMGAPIDGVGVQFHMDYSLPTTSMDNVFTKLAQLGLLIRVSELDIAINPVNTTTPSSNVTFIPTPILYTQQAIKYKYLAESYLTNVPAAQRYGISVWGIDDKSSWINTKLKPDYPLLWDSSFNKKSAYYKFLEGLQLK
ncbi:MAG: endo-1,4-beta-xylanase [Niabella sp.]